MGGLVIMMKSVAMLMLISAAATLALPSTYTSLNVTALNATGGSCDEGDECWDMRMQDVSGCTSGWGLHGLWPQWAESCTHEKFDISNLDSIKSRLDQEWPSCQGSAESFWSHEWSKHGTCSGMSQLDYFTKALDLLEKYSSECPSGENCNVCFAKDLSSTM